MENLSFVKHVACLALGAVLCVSCADLFNSDDGFGYLFISLEPSSVPSSVSAFTKSGLPTADDFNISIVGPDGAEFYDGPYSACPERLEVPSGSYTVNALSSEFDEPGFDCPQFGDTQVVVVKSGQNVAVTLQCRQLNCGIHLNIDTSFSGAFPYGYLYLKGTDGTLMYDYCERRTAFFSPGSISLNLSDNGQQQTLFSRTLSAQQMLDVNVSAAVDGSSAGISLQVDTARVWLSEDFCLGGGGDEIENAYSVSDARNHVGATDVWVYGYIVGCFNSSTNLCLEAPFGKSTNIVIAGRTSVQDKSSCISVELPSGAIRDALNLADHPSNLGRQVFLRGNIVSAYFGIPGLKSPSEYQWK